MDNIIQTPIIEETEQSFLDYSLSVITDRAIPAVEDGLKPVTRRILYEMYTDGITNDKGYVKCATPIGQTLARFHPHGDSSIYGALVGISQPWNMRYPLIDFHGNNGSRDGDGAAASRYTECKLAKIAEATLNNIKSNTVDWVPTFIETEDEPIYLPGMFPNLICNGTTGIAVAMACSFLPHNLSEVMDAILFLHNNPEAKPEEVIKYIPAPDFPTGGTITNKDEIASAYLTGKGRVRVRGDYVIERQGGRDILVFTSIPYKVSKEALIVEIDTLCEDKTIEGISEIRDETNKQGVRFVVELAKGFNGDVIANKLYGLTNLETTLSINQVALVNKVPKLVSTYTLIKEYLNHQYDVFRRKTQFDLNKLKARIHILEGLAKAVEDIDNVIALIKKSNSAADAKLALIKAYEFSDAQAKAILDMKLSRLAHIEKIEIENELNEKREKALTLEEILNSKEKFTAALSNELVTFKNKFADKRKTALTQISLSKEEKEIAEIVPEDCVVVITEAGNIKRIASASYRAQKRNGKGIKNQDEVINVVLKTNTVDNLMVFSSFGKVYKLSVNDIPVGTNASRGVSIETLVTMEKNEHFVTSTFVSRAIDNSQFVWFVTKNGIIKKTNISEYTNMKRKTGIIATNLKDGDAIAKVFISKNVQLILFTKKGMSLRFDGTALTPTSRTAVGVKGINLNDKDEVVDVVYLNDEQEIVLFTKTGLMKKVATSDFMIQNRAGKGIVCYKDQEIVAACPIKPTSLILVVGNMSTICIDPSTLSISSRSGQGVMAIKDNNIIAVARID